MPPPKLAGKLVEVMKAMERVPKNGRNEFHHYSYALEADIMDAVRGKLAALGILVLTSVEEGGKQGEVTEVRTKHTFIDAESGETLEVKGYGQGADKSDKGGYKAITGACKYFLLKNFLIATGDDPESDAPAGRKRPRAAASQEPPAPAANGALARLPTRSPLASTPHQLSQIQKLAQELGLDVQKDIAAKMQIAWPPDKDTADRILKRLAEKKLEAAKR